MAIEHEEMTFIYCRPEVVETAIGTIEVDEVLALLALELGLDIDAIHRGADEISAVVPWTSPEETWAAMDRVAPPSRQDKLFVAPLS